MNGKYFIKSKEVVFFKKNYDDTSERFTATFFSKDLHCKNCFSKHFERFC